MRRVFLNLAIAAGSILAAVAILDMLVFPAALPRLPLAFQSDLPAPFRVLTQSSKRSLLPRKYIALVGDSYAQGFGDWLMEGGRWRNGPYQASHILFERCGIDVVSLGASGAGTVRGWVSAPIGSLLFLESTSRYRIERPELLLIYFYEGNDLTDNLEDLHRRFAGLAGDSPEDEETLRAAVDRIAVDRDPFVMRARAGSLWNDSVTVQFVRSALAQREPTAGERLPFEPARRESGRNAAVFGAERQELPVNIQGPPLGMPETDFERVLRLARLSLMRLREFFPHTRGSVVYIGSPAALYRFESTSVSFSDGAKNRHEAAVDAIRAASDRIAASLETIAGSEGFSFVDTRGALREAAAEGPIHGPRDWSHFNRRGYEALADILVHGVPLSGCRL